MSLPAKYASPAVAAAACLAGCLASGAGVSAAPDSPVSDPRAPALAPQTSLAFVSTREKNGTGADAAKYLGDARGPTTFGHCVVEHDDDGSRSRLDGLVEFLLPVRNTKLVAVEEIAAAEFWRTLEASLAQKPSRRIVLFVHGYSYGFAHGCRRVAQFQRAVDGDAHVILFSWPSDGNPLDYADDRADLEWSVPEIAAVIRELAERFATERIALAAHSMGTAGLLAALEQLESTDVHRPVSGDLVLLAPDYEIDEFLGKKPLLEEMIGRTTVYVSGNDRLLGLSAWHNDEPRLGQGGEHLVVASFFETIDVTPLGRYHPTGHEYHVFHPVVEADLIELLLRSGDAASRTHTVPAARDGQVYYRLANPGPAATR